MGDSELLLLGWFLGIASIVIAELIRDYFSKKSLKAQQEYGERILRRQLYHEDRKKALIELDELLRKRYKTFPEFKKSIESFLDGSSGIFVPDKLRKELKKKIWDIELFLYEQELELYGPPPEIPDDYEDWIEDLSPEELVDMELENRLSKLKGSMRESIKKYVSER